jgi:hypothetical protein
LAAIILLLATGTGRAQQPSPDQVGAIRASCRSDFMANCSGVQPGGKDALECLKRNLAKLSGACKTAVSAIIPPAPTPAAAEAPAAPTPAATTPTPAAATPQSAPAAASSAAKPTPAPAAAAKPAPARPAAVAASPPPPPPPPSPAVAAVPPAPDVMVLPPREALRIVRICAADQRVFCADVPPGGGRIIACLMRNAPALSSPCKDALAR